MDRHIDKIIKQIAEEQGLEYDDVYKAIWHTFKQVRTQLKNRLMPKILLRGFGTFIVTPIKIKAMLDSLDDKLDKEKITQEEYEEEKERLSAVLKRRNKEWNNKGRGRIF